MNENNSIYRLALRGNHIDFAAPGVRIRNAGTNDDYIVSSGTSFASPFAAAIIAETRVEQSLGPEDTISLLIANVQDLGRPGRDKIYGHGLIHSPHRTSNLQLVNQNDNP